MKKYLFYSIALLTLLVLVVACNDDDTAPNSFFPAPLVLFDSEGLEVDLNTPENPEIVVRVRSLQGLKSVRYGFGHEEYIDGNLQEVITEVGEELPGGLKDTLFLRFSPHLTAKATFISIVATDLNDWATHSRLPVTSTIGEAPRVSPDNPVLPQDIGTMTSYNVKGNIKSDVGLKSLKVYLLRLKPDTEEGETEELLSEITEFNNIRDYNFNVSINNTEFLVGVRLLAEDWRAQQGTGTIKEGRELRVINDFELRGVRNRKSSIACFSITTSTGYIYDDPQLAGSNDTSFGTTNFGGQEIQNGALVDFIFWSPPVPEIPKYELLSPLAAKGGPAGNSNTFFGSRGPYWERVNTTSFKKIGNTDPEMLSGIPKINWDTFDYTKLMSYDMGSPSSEGGKLSIEDTRTPLEIAGGLEGQGLKVGDVILIESDPAKLYMPSKRAVIRVKKIVERETETGISRTETRLVFDMKAE